MITKFKIFEGLTQTNYENIHRQLNELFTNFREEIPYLKNIWFTFTYNDMRFEFNIIWFYSYKTSKLISKPNESYVTLYKITQDHNNDDIITVENYIKNVVGREDIRSFIDVTKRVCLNLNTYQDYKSYPNLKALMKNDLMILDYDKFLIEFEEELKESGSEELYNLIDKFYILLHKADNDKRKEVEKYFKDKYEYIYHSKKYNL